MSFFNDYISTLYNSLNSMIVTDKNCNLIEHDEAIREFVNISKDVRDNNGYVFFVGNGSSFAIAEIIAFEALQNADIKTITASNASYITAVGNDEGFLEVFNLQIKRMFSENDLLITISSSGNSENIINTMHTARNIGGKIITLSAMKENNNSRKLGDLNFYVPAKTYSTAEIAHLSILQSWLDLYINIYKKQENEQKYIDRGLKQ